MVYVLEASKVYEEPLDTPESPKSPASSSSTPSSDSDLESDSFFKKFAASPQLTHQSYLMDPFFSSQTRTPPSNTIPMTADIRYTNIYLYTHPTPNVAIPVVLLNCIFLLYHS